MNYSILSIVSVLLLVGCASKTPSAIESANKEVKFREVYICYVDDLKLTIENSSYQELTEDEAHEAFLIASKKRNINPKKCHKKGNPPEYKEEQ